MEGKKGNLLSGKNKNDKAIKDKRNIRRT